MAAGKLVRIPPEILKDVEAAVLLYRHGAGVDAARRRLLGVSRVNAVCVAPGAHGEATHGQ